MSWTIWNFLARLLTYDYLCFSPMIDNFAGDIFIIAFVVRIFITFDTYSTSSTTIILLIPVYAHAMEVPQTCERDTQHV